MANNLIVTAPCVIARDEQGRDVYLYTGTPVPANIPDKEVKRLRALNVLGEGEQTSNGDAEVQTPVKSAPAGDWTAYAISQGMDAQRAAKLKKADLVGHYLDGKALPDEDTTPPAPPVEEPKTGTGEDQDGDGDTPPPA